MDPIKPPSQTINLERFLPAILTFLMAGRQGLGPLLRQLGLSEGLAPVITNIYSLLTGRLPNPEPVLTEPVRQLNPQLFDAMNRAMGHLQIGARHARTVYKQITLTGKPYKAPKKRGPHKTKYRYPKKMLHKSRKRKGRKHHKRRKFVTSAGVKKIIAKNEAFIGQKTVVNTYNSGWCYGQFNARGFAVIPFNYMHYNVVGITGDMNIQLQEALRNVPDKTDSASFPNPPSVSNVQGAYQARKSIVHMMIHNPMTEMVKVTMWLLDQTQDEDLAGLSYQPWHNPVYPITPPTGAYDFNHNYFGPLYNWFDEWKRVDGGTGSSQTFAQDKLSYPTEYKAWQALYKIKRKQTFWLQPGQTIEMKIPIKGFNYNYLNLLHHRSTSDAANVMYTFKNITQWVMFMTEGVPTHQNTGEVNTYTSVGTTATGLEFTWKYRTQVAATAKIDMPIDYMNYNEDTVTAAKTLINPAPELLQSV